MVVYGDVSALPDQAGELPLSAIRRNSLSLCRSASRRRQGIGGELLLVFAWEAFRGRAALPLPLQLQEKGKPFLPGEEVFFSLSHSGDYAACALSDRPVGLDLEMAGPLRESVLRRCFSTAEQHFTLSSPSPDDAFFALWTEKESYGKALGEGICFPLAELDVLNPPKGSSFWHCCREGFHLSVCVRGDCAVPERIEKVDLSAVLEDLRRR